MSAVWSFLTRAVIAAPNATGSPWAVDCAVIPSITLPKDMVGDVRVYVLPPGESLKIFRDMVQDALEGCKKAHRKGHQCNMNVSGVNVSEVGLQIDEELNLSFYAVIDEAKCDALERAIHATVSQETDIPIEIRSEW